MAHTGQHQRMVPKKMFKDMALPGVYKVAVTGSTNVVVKYNLILSYRYQ